MTGPVKPKEGSWRKADFGSLPGSEQCEWYTNPFGVVACSTVEIVNGRLEYHVSFSVNGDRVPQGFMEALIRQWGLESFEEDNHVPNGKVRNFWHKVEGRQEACPCKENEKPTEEVGGYVWREDKEGMK